MLTLITGQPGNGKSLYTIATVEAKRQAESRPVFYHGIPDLTLPWTKLEDPAKWYDCPEKSIIVIDEVQKVMPPRPSGSKPPQLVSELETHRHRGFDLFFMTQDPSLVDNHLKKLAGEHIHLVRQWGRQKADLFKMQKVQDPTNANLKRALHSVSVSEAGVRLVQVCRCSYAQEIDSEEVLLALCVAGLAGGGVARRRVEALEALAS